MVTLIQKYKIEHVLLEPQAKWEFIKYKIKELSIQFSNNLVKEKRENLSKAEKVISEFENTPSNNISLDEYNENKNIFDTIINKRTNGRILRSKTQICQNGEKPSIFFLNLEEIKGWAKHYKNTMLKSEQPKWNYYLYAWNFQRNQKPFYWFVW